MISRTLADHVLRTLAAVPLPESVLVVGSGCGAMAADIAALGFRSVHRLELVTDPSDESAHEGYGWAVMVIRDGCREGVEESLARIRPRLRPGGWAIIGCEPAPMSGTMASTWDPQADVNGFAVAEELVWHPDGFHVILRRIDAGTVH